jgi:undecaprenyl-diphosphatase
MSNLSILVFWDTKISETIIYLRSDFFNHFFFFVTGFGEWKVITALFIIISFGFYLSLKRDLIFPFFISVFGSGVTALIIKYIVDRSRPGSGIALYHEKLSSFPSAHAALACAFFGFLIYCLWRFDISVRLKIVLSSIFSLMIILVSFSRLYLGVHYLSDVLAGFLTGLLWLIITMYVSYRRAS